jgi:hypothetical protein
MIPPMTRTPIDVPDFTEAVPLVFRSVRGGTPAPMPRVSAFDPAPNAFGPGYVAGFWAGVLTCGVGAFLAVILFFAWRVL